MNNPLQDGKRIPLNAEVRGYLVSEVKRLKDKGTCYKVNEAKLANVIIEIFCTQFLTKAQDQLEQRFFDKKIYLKTLIEKSASEDELSKSLNAFLSQNKNKKIKRSHAVQNDNSEASE